MRVSLFRVWVLALACRVGRPVVRDQYSFLRAGPEWDGSDEDAQRLVAGVAELKMGAG